MDTEPLTDWSPSPIGKASTAMHSPKGNIGTDFFQEDETMGNTYRQKLNSETTRVNSSIAILILHPQTT